MDSKALILEYQENFADNLSEIAYGKIIENHSNKNCYYENKTIQRNMLEKKMKYFNLDFNYLSSNQVESITKKAFLLNNNYINKSEIKKNKQNKNILNIKHFSIADIDLIDEKITEKFKFKNLNFITNFDILEKIKTNNSIGLYINAKDIIEDKIDYEYINKAAKRLNKYIKQPKLYIFSKMDIYKKLNIEIDYKIFNIKNQMEEFYFLQNTKHNIIVSAENSYSENLWASILNQEFHSYKIYQKKNNKKLTNKSNWIGT